MDKISAWAKHAHRHPVWLVPILEQEVVDGGYTDCDFLLLCTEYDS